MMSEDFSVSSILFAIANWKTACFSIAVGAGLLIFPPFWAGTANAHTPSTADIRGAEPTSKLRAENILSPELLTPEERRWLNTHPKIVLGTDKTWTPYVIPGENGSVRGVEADFLDRINTLTGANISLELGSWNDMVKKARSREIDGLALGTKTPERSDFLLFSDTSYSVHKAIFIKKGDSKKIYHLSGLKGLRIGFQEGNAVEENILKKEAGLIPVPAKDTIALLDSLRNNRVDAVLASMNLRITAIEQMAFETEVAFVVPGAQVELCYSTRNDWPLLQSIINKGLAAIPFQEKLGILKKWELPFEAASFSIFTDKEIQWLKAHPVIRVATRPDWAPLEFTDSNNTARGIAVDYLRLMEKRMGVRFDIITDLARHRIKGKVDTRYFDMLSCAPENSDSKEAAYFTSPYMMSSAVIFAPSDLPYVGNLSQLKGKTIAVIEKDDNGRILARDYPDIIRMDVPDMKTALAALQDTAAAFLGNPVTISHYLARDGNHMVKVIGETPYTYSMAMASRKDWPVFASILQKALDSIGPEEKNRVYGKWVSLKYDHGFNYSLFWKIAAGFLCVSFVFFWFNFRLKQQVQKKTRELWSSEKKYRELYYNAQVGQVRTALEDGKILECNDKLARILGYDSRKACMADYLTSAHYVDAGVRDKIVKQLIEKGYIENVQAQLTKKDGTPIWVEFSGTHHPEDNFAEVAVSDITKRKLAQKRLKKSEEKFKTVADFTFDWEEWIGPDGDYLYVSPSCERITGYAKDAFLTDSAILKKIVFPDDLDMVLEHYAIKAHDRRIHHFKFRIITKTGGIRWIGHFCQPVYDSKGNWIGKRCSNRDITEQQQSRLALLSSQKQLQIIFDNAPSVMLLVNETLEILKINQTGLKAAGSAPNELALDSIGNVFNCEVAFGTPKGCGYGDACKTCIIRRTVKQTFATGQQLKKIEAGFKVKRKDTVSEWIVLISTSPVKEPPDKTVLITLDDITKLKEMEGHLQQAQKMESIGTLAGGIAHDFNNILSAIFGYSELILDQLEKETTLHGMQEQIFAAAGRAKNLVNQILLFSRQTVQKKGSVQPDLILKEAVKFLKASIPATIEIKYKISPDCGSILADPTQLHQVFMNLCTNAYHTMQKKGGTLGITLSTIHITPDDRLTGLLKIESGRYVKIEISDTGDGIDPAIIDKIFDPYFTTKSKGEGTGLGLSVVHGIIKNSKGHIKVYSEPGKGSSFQIYFPQIKTSQCNGGYNNEMPLSKGNERICLVDDEKMILVMMQVMLENLGYKISGFTRASEALKAFKDNPDTFDLIITDLTMPQMTGVELIRQVFDIDPDFPVILCSGFSEVMNREQAKTLGVKEFLSKPVLRSDMAHGIRKALG